MIGQTISHYKILEEIGAGGMGVVYKAQDTKLDRTVALKFLPPHISINKEEKQRFIHEAKAAAALNHINIVTIYEINEFEDQTYIAMEYLEGETLKDKIASGPLPINNAIDTAIQIAEGLQEAHQNHIVHRDIKSANIIITDKGQVKILDFGLAKLKGVTKLTKEGTTLGTVAYMSPEQASGDKVDHRSDIWSLGVLLYEMITGQLPFKGEYEQAIMYAIMNEEPEPITGLRTGVPVDLDRIINKLLAKDLSKRFQHADELIVDLKEVKQDSEPEKIPFKKKTKPEKTYKIPRRFLTIAGIFLLAAILLAAYLLFKGKPEPLKPLITPGDKPSLAVVYFENNSGDKNLDNWRSGLSELIITDLSQSRYIKVLPSDRIFGILKKLNLLEAKKYSSNDLKTIAAQGRASYVLKGSYMKAGENFIITAMLQNVVKGKIISSLKVESRGVEGIFQKVDELSKKVKLDLNLSLEQIKNDLDKEVAKITTSSPEALKYYMEGMRQSDFIQAILLMKKALAIDPEFAMAYRSMAAHYGNLGLMSEKRKYLQKALELSDRVSIREYYNIQGSFYSMSEKTYEKAFEVYKKLLQLYPVDFLGNHNLGILHRLLEQWDKAIQQFEKIRHSNRFITYEVLADSYKGKGLYDKSREVLEDWQINVSDNANVHRALSDNYICQGKYEHAITEADRVFFLDPTHYSNFLLRGCIYLLKGEMIKSEKEYLKLLEAEDYSFYGRSRLSALYLLQGKFEKSKDQLKQGIELPIKLGEREWESWFHLFLAYLNLKSGNSNEALKNCNKGWDSAVEVDKIDKQINALHLKGLIYLKMKSMDLTQKARDALEELIQKGMNQKLMRFYYHLMGMIELKNKNFSKAIEFFHKTLSLLHFQNIFWVYEYSNDHALFRNSLASAYYHAGDYYKAEEEYRKITSLTTGRLFYGDIYAKAFYNLGKIYQERGWKKKAIENFHKFIELWKDCDPEFQHLIKDAGKRVKELAGNTANHTSPSAAREQDKK
jgi:serine/threonine protein kinase/Tfp pilus assembly protein PilF